MASISLSVRNRNIGVSIDVRAVDAETTFFLSTNGMNRFCIFFSKMVNGHPHRKWKLFVRVKRFCEYRLFDRIPGMTGFLSTLELWRIHGHFGDYSTEKSVNLLEHSHLQDVRPETRRAQETAEKYCTFDQTFAQMLRHFKFLFKDGKDCNQNVYDVFF